MQLMTGCTRSRLPRRAMGLLAAVVVLGMLCLTRASVRGQEPVEPPAPEKAEPAKAAPAQPKTADQPPNMIVHIILSVKWFIPVFALMSLGLVALIVLLFMDLRMSVATPPGFVEDFTDTVNKRRFKEAFEMSRMDGSYLARVLTAGMSRLQYGIEDAREAALNTVETIKVSKENLISYLATIGTLGPLLGLVGTVWGMIEAFRTLQYKGTDPKALAGDISHALSVTLVGVFLSVIAIFFHALFKNQLTKIANETSNVADDLLTQMYHNSKRPAPATAAPTATAAPAEPRAPVTVKPV